MQKMSSVSVRLRKELEKLSTHPPEGISCYLREDSFNILDASIVGIKDTPYEGGIFNLEIQIPRKYPFIPPRVVFTTPVYHPNIDEGGRICLNILKMPPNGSWRCAITIETTLISIQALLGSPNPDDPLMPDIAELFKTNKFVFEQKAKEWTEKYCKPKLEFVSADNSGNKLSKELESVGVSTSSCKNGNESVLVSSSDRKNGNEPVGVSSSGRKKGVESVCISSSDRKNGDESVGVSSSGRKKVVDVSSSAINEVCEFVNTSSSHEFDISSSDTMKGDGSGVSSSHSNKSDESIGASSSYRKKSVVSSSSRKDGDESVDGSSSGKKKGKRKQTFDNPQGKKIKP